MFLGGLSKLEDHGESGLVRQAPLRATVRWRTVANVLSMGFVIKLASLVLPANSLPRLKLRAIVYAAAATGLRAVRLPSTCDLQQKADEAFAFELIEVTDLLGREPVALRIEFDRRSHPRQVGRGHRLRRRHWLLCGHLLRRGQTTASSICSASAAPGVGLGTRQRRGDRRRDRGRGALRSCRCRSLRRRSGGSRSDSRRDRS